MRRWLAILFALVALVAVTIGSTPWLVGRVAPPIRVGLLHSKTGPMAKVATTCEPTMSERTIRDESRATSMRKIIRTTLGELIVAVTDEVMPIIRNPSGVYDGPLA